MGIKAIINKCCGVSSKPFPKLMRHKTTGSIALFTNPTNATLLMVGARSSADYGVGEVFRNVCNLPKYYEDYNEPVTLQNE